MVLLGSTTLSMAQSYTGQMAGQGAGEGALIGAIAGAVLGEGDFFDDMAGL
jgi:hypothetical protein